MRELNFCSLFRRNLMQRAFKVVLTSALSFSLFLGACKTSPPPSSVATESSTAAPSSPSAAQAPKEDVIYLDQGWSKEVREGYYHISQGSTVLPYDIFQSLEVAGGQELFRSDANSARYGLTPDPADPKMN